MEEKQKTAGELRREALGDIVLPEDQPPRTRRI